MNPAGDTNPIGTAGEGAGLEPREAARIIEQTKRQARRAFDPQAPLTAVAVAFFFLFGYGAVWWSLGDQHPAVPALWSLAVFYGLIVIVAIIGSLLFPRPTAGVGGRARRHRQAQGVRHCGRGDRRMGVPRSAAPPRRELRDRLRRVWANSAVDRPVAAYAGSVAMREDWLQLGVCIAIIGVASVSTFFGPQGAWGLTGLGCCLALLVYAAALVARQRRA